MKQGLHIHFTQQLALTPQLQQAIRLLQLSTLDLCQEIQQRLESNPMLEAASEEKEESVELETSTNEEDFEWSQVYNTAPDRMFNENDFIYETLHCTTTNLRDHLLWQLNLTPMSETDKVIGVVIIEAMNEEGFLTVSIEDLRQTLAAQNLSVERDEISAVQHLIQHFDPIGCGCSTLVETLQCQLEQAFPQFAFKEISKKIIENHLDLIGRQDFKQLYKMYHVSKSELIEILDIIKQLNPKPGNAITSNQTEYNIPDLLVKRVGDKWQVFLNQSHLPALSINHYYASLAKHAANSSDAHYLKNNLQEARWFLKSLHSRQETLLKVAQYIVSYQQDFFNQGPEAMRPLVLKEVANALELHESTVSRVTTQKFILTPFGLYELKYFFSSHLSNNKGEECSSTSIKSLIKKLINEENSQKPLSDNKIMQKIAEKGIQIARRTVTKYREEMRIGSSSERRTSRS